MQEESTFRWTRVAHGWISFALDGGSGCYRCTVSDTNDVPSELLAAIGRIVRGSKNERISFDHEPVEIRVVLQRLNDSVSLEIESFEQWGSTIGGCREWVGEWPNARMLGESILLSTQEFMTEIGESSFASGWPTYPPPSLACNALRDDLGQAELN